MYTGRTERRLQSFEFGEVNKVHTEFGTFATRESAISLATQRGTSNKFEKKRGERTLRRPRP